MPHGGIREKINNIGRGPRERCRSVPRGAPFPLFYLHHFFARLFDSRSSFFAPYRTEDACYTGCGGPRERCRSVLRGGVKKKMNDRSRTERAVSLCATGWR